MAVQDDQGTYFNLYSNRTYLTKSATGAAAVVTATAPAVVGKTFYLQGFSITSLGATAAVGVAPTIVGLITATMTFSYAAVAGVTLPNNTLHVAFNEMGLPASAQNVAVVVSCPSLGTGNTACSVNLWGYYI